MLHSLLALRREPSRPVEDQLATEDRRRSAQHGGARQTRDVVHFRTGDVAETEVVFARGALGDPVGAGVVPLESQGSPVFVLTDETVNGLYGDRFVASLRGAGLEVHRLVMPDGEEAKTLASYVHLTERVLARGIDEGSALVSLGGGAVCNVCGFIASTLYRGIRLVHVPTTLMAQCDAAISHKQAVNSSRGKNLVGNYYAPRAIVVDVDALQTLSDWRLADGLAEAVKHALAEDGSYFEWLNESGATLRDPVFLEAVIRRNVALKSALMARDPKELREGMVLQYGHTFGHPIELVSGFRFAHGMAVAMGMMIAARVSVMLGGAPASLITAHETILRRFDLPTQLPRDLPTVDILEALRRNKRYLVGETRMALLAEVGRLWSLAGETAIPVPEATLVEALQATRAPKLAAIGGEE